ncbi:MAG TPA: hypothetical protein VFO84_04820 [Dehalococcoidia bacterium]|nr:hypothetical protein [Dehalococcoidia bacterium]
MYEVFLNSTVFRVHAQQRLSESQQMWRTVNQCPPANLNGARNEAVTRVLPCGKQVAATPSRLVAQR